MGNKWEPPPKRGSSDSLSLQCHSSSHLFCYCSWAPGPIAVLMYLFGPSSHTAERRANCSPLCTPCSLHLGKCWSHPLGLHASHTNSGPGLHTTRVPIHRPPVTWVSSLDLCTYCPAFAPLHNPQPIQPSHHLALVLAFALQLAPHPHHRYVFMPPVPLNPVFVPLGFTPPSPRAPASPPILVLISLALVPLCSPLVQHVLRVFCATGMVLCTIHATHPASVPLCHQSPVCTAPRASTLCATIRLWLTYHPNTKPPGSRATLCPSHPMSEPPDVRTTQCPSYLTFGSPPGLCATHSQHHS